MDRNNTDFPTELAAFLRKVHAEYRALQRGPPLPEGPLDRARLARALKYYQYLVYEYMGGVLSPGPAAANDRPRGLLLYHQMGLGKTFDALAVALAAAGAVAEPGRQRRPPRRVILVASKTLHANFEKTIGKLLALAGADGGAARRLRAALHYVTLDAHNMADQVLAASSLLGERRRGGETRGALDGALVVVDEAHAFFGAVINSPAPTSNARRLYTMIMEAADVRLLFLTGTPAAKHPFELVPCFNMLAGKEVLPAQYDAFMRFYVDGGGHRMKNLGRLSNRLLGLVSYVGYDVPTDAEVSGLAGLAFEAPPGYKGAAELTPEEADSVEAHYRPLAEVRALDGDHLFRFDESGEFVGHAAVRPLGSTSSVDGRPPPSGHRWLEEVFVREGRRKEGEGSRLVAAAAGLGRVALLARPPLEGFYRRLGFEPCSPQEEGGAPPNRAKDGDWVLLCRRDRFPIPAVLPLQVEEVQMSAQQYRQYLMAREKEAGEGGRRGQGGGAGRGSAPPPPLALPGSERGGGSTYYVQSRMLSNFALPRRYAKTGRVLDPNSIAQVDPQKLPDDAFTADSSPKFARMMENIAATPGPFMIYSQFTGIGGLAVAQRFLECEGYVRFRPGRKTGGAAAEGGASPEGARPSAETALLYYDEAETAAVERVAGAQCWPGEAAPLRLTYDELRAGEDTLVGRYLPYREGERGRPPPAVRAANHHRGQRKLFLSEVGFLAAQGAAADAPFTVLYAGSAPGVHLPLLASLYPAAEFHLYDPAPFSPAVRSHPRLHPHREFFTDAVAAAWAGRADYFICDIRGHGAPAGAQATFPEGARASAEEGKVRHEQGVLADLRAQEAWTRTIRPSQGALLKFRLPYLDSEGALLTKAFPSTQAFRYLDGELMWQCWAPPMSGETRLAVDCRPAGWDRDRMYPCRRYESACYTRNLVGRPWLRFEPGAAPPEGFVGTLDQATEVQVWESFRAASGCRTPVAELAERLSTAVRQPGSSAAGATSCPGREVLLQEVGTAAAAVVAREKKARARRSSRGRHRGGGNVTVAYPALERAFEAFPPGEWEEAARAAATAPQKFKGLDAPCPAPASLNGTHGEAGWSPPPLPLKLFGLDLPRRSIILALLEVSRVLSAELDSEGELTVRLSGSAIAPAPAGGVSAAESFTSVVEALLAPLAGKVTVSFGPAGAPVAVLEAPGGRAWALDIIPPAARSSTGAKGTAPAPPEKAGSGAYHFWPCWGKVAPPLGPPPFWRLTGGPPGSLPANPPPSPPSAACHLVLGEAWSRYCPPASAKLGEAGDPTGAAGYDGCWSCTAEAHTWQAYLRQLGGEAPPAPVAYYMDYLSEALDEPLLSRHSAHGRFPVDTMAAAVSALGAAMRRSLGTRRGGAEAPALGGAEPDKPSHGGPAPRFAVVSGEVPPAEREEIRKLWTSPENADGALLRGILVSKTGATGFDLANGRQVHITEPYWYKTLENQAVTRFARLGALLHLPPELRHIRPFLYLAAANREVIDALPPDALETPVFAAATLPPGATVDLAFHQQGVDREKLNVSAREALQLVSIERALTGECSASRPCRQCRPTNVRLFHESAEEDLRLPDPCELLTEVQVVAKKVELGGVAYRYVADPASALGFRFFQQGEGRTWAEVDPSAPLYMELYSLVAGDAP